ncbi:MAG: hypothetical protein JXA52_07710, partial [Planctomycetes bacterium]|nr:hypothetical protein [Planctomycetota bacterium]
MLINEWLQSIPALATPLTNALVALPLALLLPRLLRGKASPARWALTLLIALGLFAAYYLLAGNKHFGGLLIAMNSPLFAVLLLIALPALHLPRGKIYHWFLILPGLCILLAIWAVFDAYQSVPEGQEGFYWFLIRPAWLFAGVVSIIVLLEPLLSLGNFRWLVRGTCLLVLACGGFAFRQDYQDYQGMLARRQDQVPGIMNLSETSPVLLHDKRMLYLPSAPCRFTADGGYV